MKIVSKYLSGYRLVIIFLVLFIYIGSTMCKNVSFTNDKKVFKIYGANENYIGSQACISCHKELYEAYITSPHYNSSAVIAEASFKNNYGIADSVVYNKDLFVKIEKQGDGIYQTAYSGGRKAATHRMDMLMGSGKKGQTFLFWNDSSLYQLPLSYSYVHNRWINSPGYPVDKVLFNREISIKCLECHATYANEKSNENNKAKYDSSKLVLSISCETCHGPGKKHLEFHTENPDVENARFIINAGKLSRQQQLDACANCHSGIRENIKPSFSFLPGNNLNEFSRSTYNKDSSNVLDVHGNQYGLLTASECYKQSEILNCSSCHNTHLKENNKKQIFAVRCMNCHSEQNNSFCTQKGMEKQMLITNCIDCHMPLQQSSQIVFSEGNKKSILSESIRTHLVGIYNKKSGDFIKRDMKSN